VPGKLAANPMCTEIVQIGTIHSSGVRMRSNAVRIRTSLSASQSWRLPAASRSSLCMASLTCATAMDWRYYRVLVLRISELATGVPAMGQSVASYGEPYAKTLQSLLASGLSS